jgi:hypothetical protein
LHTILEVQIRYAAQLEQKARKGLPALLPIPDQPVRLVSPVRPGLADIKDIQVPKEKREPQQIRDLQVHKEKRAQLDQPAQLVQPGQPVKPDQPVQLVKRAQLVQWDLQEVLVAGFLYLQQQIRHLISRKIPQTIFWVSLQ